MTMRRIVVEGDLAIPAERAYAYLAEHEHLGKITPLRVERLRDGVSERNGVGSRRRMSVGGLLPFEETVTAAIPGELIRYQVTKGGPLRDHKAEIRFTPTECGTHVMWEIIFRPAVAGLGGALEVGLRRAMVRALPQVEARG